MKKYNFLANGEDHLKRMHEKTHKEITSSIEKRQATLNFNVSQAVDPIRREIQNIAMSFASTTLPINIFRSNNNRRFLNKKQKTEILPVYRTISNEMEPMANLKLKSGKAAEHYGIQLEHWTNRQRQHVLVILISWIDKKWRHLTKLIDFKVVGCTTGLITAKEVETLTIVGLDPRRLVAYQTDNCSSMIKSLNDFREMSQNECSDSENDIVVERLDFEEHDIDEYDVTW